MTSMMKAAVKLKPAPKSTEVRNVPIPEPTPSEVLIRVDIASICGTDVHIYDWDAWAAARIKVPLVQGHEFAGHIEKLGSGVTGFRKGDYVSAEGHIACGRCYMCRTGNAHVCKSVSILGIDRDGSFAEYMTVPASNVIVNDDDLPLDLATMQDPLGNAVYTVTNANVRGKTIAIFGLGPIGLMAVALCRGMAARTVIAIGHKNQYRMDLAKKVGASLVLRSGESLVDGVMDATAGEGVDEVLEFSGSEAAVQQAIRVVRPAGGVHLLGLFPKPLSLFISQLVAKSLDWRLRVLQGPSAPRSVVDGKRVIMLCSNNYLNHSNHPKVKRAAREAVKTHGAGSGSVRPIAGNMDLHEELERRIARFKRREAALFFMSGFAGNAGLIPQLAGEGDALLTDELNHGSIIDGVRLTKAQRVIYRHCDIGDLERALKEVDGWAKKILVITDGVFSMDGDIAPVGDIARVGEEFGAMIYVDDAHGEGVLGDGGRGVASHFHVEEKIQIELGTFSKALGVVGGYIAGSNDLRNYSLNKSRTWLLSGSHPPAVAAACTAAIDVLETEPRHVKKLWSNTKYFKKRLVSMGFDIGRSATPITPVMLGDSAIAKRFSDRLFEEGVFALPIVYPMVAKDQARIRNIVNAGLRREDRETVDPGLARIVRPQDHAYESVSIEGAQIRAGIAPKLFAEGSRAVPSPRLRIRARDLEQRDHCVVVRSTQRTEPNRHG